MASIIPKTCDDIVSIVENRANIAGEVQKEDRDFIIGVVNEYHMTISTERSWHWRSFERAYNFNMAITTGTANVTNGSREVTMTGITVADIYLGRSIRFGNQREIYRIIGREVATNKFYLDAGFVGQTNLTSSYKMYEYEFPLPPDCDILNMTWTDTGGIINASMPAGEMEELNVVEFNRFLSAYSDWRGVPQYYTRDGDVHYENWPPLDVMVLDYDFLAGEVFEKASKIRIFPIEPDIQRTFKIHYSKHVEFIQGTQQPLMPLDNRWILVHFALAEWYKNKGQSASSDREYKTAENLLKEMRNEFHKTDSKPQFIVDGRRYYRARNFTDNKYLFRISRYGEYP